MDLVLTICKPYRVMIIDLDAHQGNGHETDFANDSRFTSVILSSGFDRFSFGTKITFSTTRSSLYSGHVQPWDISISKLPSP